VQTMKYHEPCLLHLLQHGQRHRQLVMHASQLCKTHLSCQNGTTSLYHEVQVWGACIRIQLPLELQRMNWKKTKTNKKNPEFGRLWVVPCHVPLYDEWEVMVQPNWMLHFMYRKEYIRTIGGHAKYGCHLVDVNWPSSQECNMGAL